MDTILSTSAKLYITASSLAAFASSLANNQGAVSSMYLLVRLIKVQTPLMAALISILSMAFL